MQREACPEKRGIICRSAYLYATYPAGLELFWPQPMSHFIEHKFPLYRSPVWALGRFCALAADYSSHLRVQCSLF